MTKLFILHIEEHHWLLFNEKTINKLEEKDSCFIVLAVIK